jgi:hypothetical protein
MSYQDQIKNGWHFPAGSDSNTRFKIIRPFWTLLRLKTKVLGVYHVFRKEKFSVPRRIQICFG